MVRVRFRTAEGAAVREITGAAGSSLMVAAVDHHIEGIEAACGGSQVCGTCQVYVDEPWYSQLPPQAATEREILDYAVHVQSNSRLACQIILTESLDGLSVTTPPSQI